MLHNVFKKCFFHTGLLINTSHYNLYIYIFPYHQHNNYTLSNSEHLQFLSTVNTTNYTSTLLTKTKYMYFYTLLLRQKRATSLLVKILTGLLPEPIRYTDIC